ncbi:hypothetical protein B0J14DRAFT_560400 [Halenospora varia]|nr:hypothetical protein B0J14DRAFT_560400 [Halenospora varia]
MGSVTLEFTTTILPQTSTTPRPAAEQSSRDFGLCPGGYFACPAEVGGGCCPEGSACTQAGCQNPASSSGSHPASRSNKVTIAVGVSMAAIVIIGIALGIYRYRKRKAVTGKGSPSEAHERKASDEMCPVIDGRVVYEMEDKPQVSEMRETFWSTCRGR